MTSAGGPGDAAMVLRLFTEIGIISQLTTAAAAKMLAPTLNPSEFGLLQHFSLRGDGQMPSELARVMQVTKPSMTAMLGKLSTKGFVAISPDASDGRRLRVHVTEAGRAAHRTAATMLGELVGATTAGLDYAALASVLPVLADLRAHLDALRD